MDNHERKMKAGAKAAATLGALDDNAIAAFDRAARAMYEYAVVLIERGLQPTQLLTQMTSVATEVFTERLLPGLSFTLKEDED